MDFKADFITLFTKIKENILILMKTQGIAAEVCKNLEYGCDWGKKHQ